MVTATKSNNRMAKDMTPGKAAKKSGEAPSVFDGNAGPEEHAGPNRKAVWRRGHHALGQGTAVQIEGIPTGSLSLDLALGGQGIPKGRIVEVFGPESSGKTTLALHVVARPRRTAASRPLSTPSTPWTPVGPKSWASTWKPCWSASPAAAKRRCTSPRC